MSESGTLRTYSHVRVESEQRRITDSRAGRNEPIRASMGDGVICPTGFRRRGLSSLSCKNILLFRIPKSVVHFRLPSHLRGVSRSSRARGGMRWTLTVLLTRAPDADGEVVWSWRLSGWRQV